MKTALLRCINALPGGGVFLRGFLRLHNNYELRSIACELHSGTDETLGALTTQLANLQDGLKAGQSTAQLLTRRVALADQAFQQILVLVLLASLGTPPPANPWEWQATSYDKSRGYPD